MIITALRGAAETDNIETLQQVISTSGIPRSQVRNMLDTEGWFYQLMALGGRPNPVVRIIKGGRWPTVQQHIEQKVVPTTDLADIIARVAPVSLIQQLIRYGATNVIDPHLQPHHILRLLAASDRPEVFIEVMNWLRQAPDAPLLDLSGIMELARYGHDFRLSQWAQQNP